MPRILVLGLVESTIACDEIAVSEERIAGESASAALTHPEPGHEPPTPPAQIACSCSPFPCRGGVPADSDLSVRPGGDYISSTSGWLLSPGDREGIGILTAAASPMLVDFHSRGCVLRSSRSGGITSSSQRGKAGGVLQGLRAGSARPDTRTESISPRGRSSRYRDRLSRRWSS